jgi:sugar O-acyltransferase (sialic acid O-acetyltransferase NeuD family)
MSDNNGKKTNVAILGGSGHGTVIADALARSDSLRLLGFIDSRLVPGDDVSGHRVLGRVEDIPTLVHSHELDGLIIGVGDNWIRARLVETARTLAPGILFPNVFHPSAVVSRSTSWGEGNVVLAGAIVNCGATAGDFCILNTSCSVDHDCRLGDYVSVAPQACVGGNVRIGDYAVVCLGARVIHQIHIGAHTVIGAGSTVLRDVPSHVTAYGTPARVVRSREVGDAYLTVPAGERDAVCNENQRF